MTAETGDPLPTTPPTTTTTDPPTADPARSHRVVRWAVSVWLAFHLGAMVVAPAAVGPSSDLAQSAWAFYRPYLQALYLNNGWHFFAPEPAESTLLGYAAERPDGTVVRGRIPNFGIRPRLLYHRHFMLTEHMAQAPPELEKAWHESYARHVGRKFGATRVSLTRQTHYLAPMEEVRKGTRLDAPASYEEQPLGVFRCAN